MMKLPLVVLAVACAAIGLLSPWLVPRLGPAVEVLQAGSGTSVQGVLDGAGAWLAGFVVCTAGVAVVTALLLLLRRGLLAGRDVRAAVTWDCGYTAPTPRMQYTASSFVQPLTALFRPLLGTNVRTVPPVGPFPQEASFSTETPDAAHEHLYAPFFRAAERAATRMRWLQHGRLQLYVLYVAATLVVLLFWELVWNS